MNLRGISFVHAGRNSKGIALFALAALANYRRSKTNENEREARQLLNDLYSMRLEGWSGSAWGYNFDWQSRAFFAPRGTPTIVPTAFAARAFIEAAQAFEDDTYLETARSVCDFILQDLPRSEETRTEICFSYAPGTVNRIYNASLLAAETLASVAALTGEQELCHWAVKAARYVVSQQHENGSWVYGAEENQAWVDNFHSAYLLSSLRRVISHCQSAQTPEFDQALQSGYKFWRTGFFLADGWPKYYHDQFYPVDAHAAATAIVTFLELGGLDGEAWPGRKRSPTGLSATCAMSAASFITSDAASTLCAPLSCGGPKPGCYMHSPASQRRSRSEPRAVSDVLFDDGSF